VDGRDLHLFEKVPPAHLRYLGQFICSGYQLIDNVPDVKGSRRRAIAFELAPLQPDETDDDQATDDVSGLSLEKLRQAALQPPPEGAGPAQAKRNAYYRSAAVRAYVLARANGICEGCHEPAPLPNESLPNKSLPTVP
jgi:5-methylcytosine-specific restriction enzyme A